jgi:hypothetical protein
MSLIKYLVVGAAVAAGVNYATKKRENGRSLVDDLSEKAPEWMDKAKQYTDKIKGQYMPSSNSNFETGNPPY